MISLDQPLYITSKTNKKNTLKNNIKYTSLLVINTKFSPKGIN